jgi:hypothetical protein
MIKLLTVCFWLVSLPLLANTTTMLQVQNFGQQYLVVGHLSFPPGVTTIPQTSALVSEWGSSFGVTLGTTNDVIVMVDASSTNVFQQPSSFFYTFTGWGVGLVISAALFTAWAIVQGLKARPFGI